VWFYGFRRFILSRGVFEFVIRFVRSEFLDFCEGLDVKEIDG